MARYVVPSYPNSTLHYCSISPVHLPEKPIDVRNHRFFRCPYYRTGPFSGKYTGNSLGCQAPSSTRSLLFYGRGFCSHSLSVFPAHLPEIYSTCNSYCIRLNMPIIVFTTKKCVEDIGQKFL